MRRMALEAAKKPTIRMAMVAVAVVAVALGVVSNERWRWGSPRRLMFDRGNALGWLETVCRRDYRMYDHEDVASLLRFIARERLLVGESKERVHARLGIPFAWKPASDGSEPKEFFFLIGVGPLWNGPGPPELRCRFDANGKCIEAMSPDYEESRVSVRPEFITP